MKLAKAAFFESSAEDTEKKVKSKKNKEIKLNKKDKESDTNPDSSEKSPESQYDEEDEFNVSLAAMEEEIKPRVTKIIENLSKYYAKLKKYQIEKLNCLLNGKELSISKNKDSSDEYLGNIPR